MLAIAARMQMQMQMQQTQKFKTQKLTTHNQNLHNSNLQPKVGTNFLKPNLLLKILQLDLSKKMHFCKHTNKHAAIAIARALLHS